MTEERHVGAGVESEVADEALSPTRSPSAAPVAEATTAARRRPRSLRIPDDEVARPLPAVPEGGGESVPAEAALTPSRIITIGIDPPQRVGPPPGLAPAPPTVPSLPLDDEDGSEVTQPGAHRERLSSMPEEVEVRFDEDGALAAPSARADVAPTSNRERLSDAPEIAAEDVVTVDPPAVARSIPPMRARVSSQPPVPPPPKPLGPVVPVGQRTPLVIVPPHVGDMPAAPSPDATGARRKTRLWWEELFNDDYLHAMERITDEQIACEVVFIEESLGVERGGALLDLACGTGRHAVELARRGYEVVGLDLSLAMLARAGEDAQEQDAKLNFMQGDMREMTFEEQFDGIYCWNTSFGYFEEDKNAQVIDRVHRALKGGGLFLLDVVNRDFIVRQSPSLAWFEGDGCVCMDEMSVDFITSRLKVKRTMMLDEGRSREIEYSMRVYSLHELGRVLHEHGFRVREVSGRASTPGVFFGSDSPRSIILAEKR